MEDQISRLIDKVWDRHLQLSTSTRLLIAISGIPGSGKTILANSVTDKLNSRYHEKSAASSRAPIAALVPMDGYHLSRAQLSAMPDPVIAHARRGAAFTIDGPGFLRLVESLRQPITSRTETLYAPSFDHAVKDPVYNDIILQATTRIVIFEGLYLSLNSGSWKAAAELMDELWFVEVDLDTARRRLIDRHVKAGIANNAEEAERRANENDLVNGKQIMDERLDVHEVITSYHDHAWIPKE